MQNLVTEKDSTNSAKKVIIVGGGFGGLNAAQTLIDAPNCEVTVLDRRNHHVFQPLLYQVAMAALSPAEIAAPIRGVLSDKKNVRTLLGEVSAVDTAARTITTDFGKLSYDYLILACGAQHSYFGRDDWEMYAPGLKTIEQATEIRRRVLLAFELAEREGDPVKKEQLQTFVIVGGGPTGIELAGALGEISLYTIEKDFKRIDKKDVKIILVEAGPRILPSFDESLAKRAGEDLQRMGITISTSSKVTNIDANGVTIGDRTIKAKTVLWAAGVMASSLNKTLGPKLDPQGRVAVGADLSVQGHPEVFVIGDQARAEENGKVLPGLAPVAIQQGRYVGELIKDELKGKARKNFHYVDKGQLATIGRKLAIGQFAGFKLHGTLAWFAWLVVHIYYLIGFRNRTAVFLEWVWSYLSFQRGARLIVNEEWRTHSGSQPKPEIIHP